MKVFGSISRLVSILFRKDSQDITLRPNQATTYTAARDIQFPAGDSDQVLISASSTKTLTNTTFDADGTGNTISNIENADIKAGAAIDAAKLANGLVSNTEFQYLDGVTSAIQTQLTARVVGPASSTDNAVTRWDTTTGKLVKDSLVTISNLGAVAGATQLDVDNLRLDANTLSSTNTNGNIVLDPAGTGEIQASANLNVLDGAVLKLSDADSSAFIGHKSPAVVASSVTYQWPEAPATSGYVLAATTGGVMSWVSNAATNSFVTDWVTGDGTTKTVTHNLGSLDVMIQLYDKSNGETISPDTAIRTNSNTVTLTASEAPNASGWRVLITVVA